MSSLFFIMALARASDFSFHCVEIYKGTYGRSTPNIYFTWKFQAPEAKVLEEDLPFATSGSLKVAKTFEPGGVIFSTIDPKTSQNGYLVVHRVESDVVRPAYLIWDSKPLDLEAVLVLAREQESLGEKRRPMTCSIVGSFGK